MKYISIFTTKGYLFVLLLLFSFKLQAQIIYTSSDFASVNDSFVVSTVPIFNLVGEDFSPTDTAAVWDFSQLNPLSQRLVQFESPNRTGFAAAYLLACNANCYTPCYADCIANGGFSFFCQGACGVNCQTTCLANWANFNLAELVNDSLNLGIVALTDVYNLYNKNTSRLAQDAMGIKIANIPLVVEFNSPDILYKFPIAFADSGTYHSSYRIALDSIPGTGINFGFAYKHDQTRTTVIDGWGQLTTPYQTFDSVLRMRSVIANRDSITVQGTTITLGDFLPSQFIPDTVVEYKWLDKATGIPVLRATAWRINGTEVYQNAEFTDTVRCFDPLALFGYLPIPATLDNSSDSVEVNFYSQSFNVDNYSWNFADTASTDNTSTDNNPSHFYTEGGIYNVTLTTCNTACPFPRCDDIVIPVIVIDNRTNTGIDDIETEATQGIKVYPNPFSSELTVDWENDQGTDYDIRLFTLTGQQVYAVEGNATDHEVNFQLPDLPGSVYLLKVVLNNKTYFKKVYAIQ